MPGQIRPEDVFDFEGYFKRLAELEVAADGWAQSTTASVNRIKASFDSALKDLLPLKEGLKGLSVTKDGADKQITDYIAKIGQVGPRVAIARESLSTLTEAQRLNGQLVADLTAKLGSLHQRYQALDPTQKNHEKQQKAILREVKSVSQAIDAQSKSLKVGKAAFDAAEGSYQHLSKQTAELKNQLRQMPDALDLVTGKINQHNKAAVDMLARIQANDKALKAADSSMGNYGRNVGNYGNAISGMGKSLLQNVGGLIGISSAFEAITATIQVTADMERLDAGLKAVSRDTDDFNRSQQFLLETSDELGLRYDSLVKSYKLLKAATKDSSLEGDETEHIFHAMTEAGAKLSLTNADVEGSLLALTQMLSKGKVTAEEMRNQLGERVPAAMKIMAQATGLSEIELNKMMEKGELLAVDVLPKFATELDKIYGGNAQEKINTMSAGWNRMTNEAQQFIASFNENKKVSTFFGIIETGIANVFKDLSTLVKSNEWGLFLNYLTGGATLGNAVAGGIRSANAMAAQNEKKFRAMPADDRQRQVNAADEKKLAIQKQLDALLDKSPTSEVTKQELALQKELNKAKAHYNYLVKTNNDQVTQEARLSAAKANEKAQADKARKEKEDKEKTAAQKKAEFAANRQLSVALGVSSSGTDNKLSALNDQRQDGLIDEQSFLEKRLQITLDGLNARQALLEKYGKKETGDYIKLQTAKTKAEQEYNRSQLQLDLKTNRSGADQQVSTLDVQHTNGTMDDLSYVEKRHKILTDSLNREKNILKEAGQGKSELYKKTETDISDEQADYLRRRLKVEEKAWKDELAKTKDAVKAVDAELGVDYEKKLQELDKYLAKKERKIKLDVANGRISPVEGEARLYATKMEYLQESLRITEETYQKDAGLSAGLYDSKIEGIKNYRDYAMLTADEIDAANKAIAELEKNRDAEQVELKKKFNKEVAENGIQQSDLETDHELKNIDKAQKKREELLKLGGDFASKLGDTTFSIISGNYERESQQLDAQHDNELRLAGDNADAKQRIDEQYQKRKTELARKQAITDREQALFSIALNTAMGVASVLSTGGGTHYADLGISAGILTAFVIATGALEAAAVLSKPLPAYKYGKLATDQYTGLALGGEAGAELLVDRDGFGQVFDKPTIFHTKPGDTVYTATQTAALLNSWPQQQAVEQTYGEIALNQQSTEALQQGQRAQWQQVVREAVSTNPAPLTASQLKEAFLEAWEEAPRHETYIDIDGLKEGIRRGNHYIEYVEKRQRLF
ncbi:tape measure protein [Spirosoma endbachense]|uniref:Tape measure protein n=1 Tax=Spirosoma endbachense TaxID=2666025 RepID=A0A6P1VVQ1_9BACT|nr:tape measure protein [Spirosoma endbachense]QHV97291.1 tape measure protein [Spirosoma endbachense]